VLRAVGHPAIGLEAHLGVHDSVEVVEARSIVEYELGQSFAHDLPLLVEDLVTEAIDDAVVRQPTLGHHVVSNLIGVDDERPELGHDARDSALARRDPAGQTDSQDPPRGRHASPAPRRAASSVLRSKRAIVSGPTPPGTGDIHPARVRACVG